VSLPRLALLYRGHLESCNYRCGYCPFALKRSSRSARARDEEALSRFVAWAGAEETRALEVVFTPYGEALIWPAYQRAVVTLTHLRHVSQVTVQTNGSGSMRFVEECPREKLSLWVSFHPSDTTVEDFAARICDLAARRVRVSVGVVATPDGLETAEALRASLPSAVSMWVNALKPGGVYDESTAARWARLDPGFVYERVRHASAGRSCRTGWDTLSVDGDGTVRRCHFVRERLGNLYEDGLGQILAERPCPRSGCECWIGYVNLEPLDLRRSYEPDALYARRRLPLP
jgi:hypothetical protein